MAHTRADRSDDLAALFERARAAEPGLNWQRRTHALDAVATVLESGAAEPAATGRDWRLELAAERALDQARANRLDAAERLALSVLDAPAPPPLAYWRAAEALGRVLAWRGTDSATRRADRLLAEVADGYADLGSTEWQGNVIFWRANAVYLQNGDLPRAAELMRLALDHLGAGSPRRPNVLSFYADVLLALGRWTDAEAALVEGIVLADREDSPNLRAYLAWTWARLASVRGDAMATERYLREAERDPGDWLDTNTGTTFLADAAELLDRVGLREQAEKYLARAVEREPEDEFVRQAEAALLARAGDPGRAVPALQELSRGSWLEKRHIWRHTLLTAWATFRVGRADAGELAARALEQAATCGAAEVALFGEPELGRALLPLAEAAGSPIARQLLLGDGVLLVRLLGPVRVTRADGTELPLPAGKPAELVRLLAAHPGGHAVEQVLDEFFPGAEVTTGRHRLRQVLARLRSACGEIVIRQDDHLALVPAWVDLREFRSAADRVRAARGSRAVQLAYGALALWGGPALPTDRYAGWAQAVREDVEFRLLNLLDLIADDAGRRGSRQEAVTALSSAVDADPYDERRFYALADHLLAMGRRATAEHLARRAGIRLTGWPQ